jgi:hypothetical protein
MSKRLWQVKNALVKEGWTITHDPLRRVWGAKDMFVDLGAEALLAAERIAQDRGRDQEFRRPLRDG